MTSMDEVEIILTRVLDDDSEWAGGYRATSVTLGVSAFGFSPDEAVDALIVMAARQHRERGQRRANFH
jgi:hypothetical protein